MSRYRFLFCNTPLEPKTVEPDYENEWEAAQKCGFDTLLYDYEILTQDKKPESAIRRISSAESMSDMIYRGWMLTPGQYADLYDALLAKNYRLINTPTQYQNCHYLPDALRFIEDRTPLTIWEKFTGSSSIERLVERAAEVFGESPVIIKDYVKSEKHDWDDACYVSNASDRAQLMQKIQKLIELRGDELNEGIVVRKFVELCDLAIHSKSGMPLTEEYRLFFLHGKLVGIYDYWEEGTYRPQKPDMSMFERYAANVESHFFTMDIARQKNGDMTIIELGDGQVSGLPPTIEADDFYGTMKTILTSI